MKLALVQGERVWTKPLSDDAKAKASRERQQAEAEKKAKRRERIKQAKGVKKPKPAKSRAKPSKTHYKPSRIAINQTVAYRPGLTPQEFYATRQWIDLRYKTLRRYGPVCQCCGAKRESGAQIHVDHIKPRSLYPELELNLDNLQVLCRECNLGKSNTDETDWR